MALKKLYILLSMIDILAKERLIWVGYGWGVGA